MAQLRLDIVEDMFFCAERWAGLAVDFDDNKTETIEIKDSERFMIQIGEYVACFVSKFPAIADAIDTIMSGLYESAAVNGKSSFRSVESFSQTL